VFDVAGMTATTRDNVPYDDPRRAAGYRERGRTIQPSLRVDTSVKLAAGGLVSNVLDMARFAIATLRDELVSPATRAQMWTPVRLTGGTVTPLGLGWQVTGAGGRIIMATGQQDEVSTLLVIFPDRKAAIVLMSNLERSVEQFVPLLNRIRAATGLE